MKRYALLGLLLALCVLFPHLFVLAAARVGTAALVLAAKPLVWAFLLGLLARPRLARRLPWRVR